MKNCIFKAVITCCILLFIMSCGKLNSDKEFSLLIPIVPAPVEFVYLNEMIQPTNAGDTRNEDYKIICDKTLNTNLSALLKSHGVNPDQIQNLNLTNVEVTVKDPETFDMTHFVGMKLFLGDSMELAAEVAKVSDDKKTLIFKVMSDNIIKYLEKDALRVVIKAPQKPMTMRSVTMILKTALSVAVTATAK